MRFILIFLCFISCGPAHDLRKAKRLIERAKTHGAIITTDTVFVDRTFITPGEKVTITLPGTIRDTIIYQDRVKIGLRIRHDTVRVNVECPPDTIIVKVPVEVKTEITCPPKSNFWKYLALALIAVTTLVLKFKK